MRCVLLLNNAEPKPGEVSPEAIAAMQEAFGAYGRELEAAGVLVAAEVLTSPAEGTSLTRRTWAVDARHGPFAPATEPLMGVFVLDVPDRATALAWAEKCPGATYGIVEVRTSATSFVDGQWS
ncbi:YciI family protein [Raineyella sp. LH-20]|uniref:YciI family protein n=1 Tax=Raineyella sp. LH-20 TaxID=3081204 RepID=UPI002952A8E4|nr:YciI family protein [Raineyella sp. LH-20]WOP17667.1 YciI family protein [Raineyella sp. LH-20]